MKKSKITANQLWEEFPSFWGRDFHGEKVWYEPTIGVGADWYPLVMEVVKKAKEEAEKEDLDIFLVGIKGKFGLLRIQVKNTTEDLNEVIVKVEKESAEMCERCGSKEGVTQEGMWVKTYCRKCRIKLVPGYE